MGLVGIITNLKVDLWNLPFFLGGGGGGDFGVRLGRTQVRLDILRVSFDIIQLVYFLLYIYIYRERERERERK